ncbi:MAG: hypothetical protein JW395_3672 [Nitrospira sp.]|nr:hypothetical protein [Nitrospira sp.]
MRLIDAHQHLWNLERAQYPWLSAEYGVINRTFTEVDAEPELARSGIAHVVLVQAANSSEDTDEMIAAANRWARVAGIVGWLHLEEPDAISGELDRWRLDSRLVGVRHLIHEEPDPDWVMRPQVLESLDRIADVGLTFDVIGTLPRHLQHACSLAERNPGLRLVIDHLGSPPVSARGWQPWADLISQAADHTNVYLKLSGLTTCADWDHWSPGDLQPYVEHALEAFGPRRLLFGGDWPVVNLAGGYDRMWQVMKQLLQSVDEQGRTRIFAGTAIEAYRLPMGTG